MLHTHSFGEPPAWDAFSKVDVRRMDPSEYEEHEEVEARKKKEETAVVKAKPMSLSGWDPETKTQSILTEEQMQGACLMPSRTKKISPRRLTRTSTLSLSLIRLQLVAAWVAWTWTTGA